METSTWVRAARKHKGLTQDQLGEALGVTKSNVSGWEQSRHEPSYSQMRRITQLTGYPMPDGALDVFSEELVAHLRGLDPAEMKRLEDELRVRFRLEPRRDDTSFQSPTAAQTAARKSSSGRSRPDRKPPPDLGAKAA